MSFVYWSGDYWQVNYWQSDYWQATPNNNTVEITSPSLTLTGQNPTVITSVQVAASLESLTLTSFNAALQSDVAVEPGAPSLTLTAYGTQTALDNWDYFSDDYFSPNYWNASYWAESNAGAGGAQDVDQLAAGQLTLSGFSPVVDVDQDVLPATETLSLAAFATDSANDYEISVGFGSLTLSGFAVNADNSGYVEGDISIGVLMTSTVTFTEGVNVGLATLSLSAQSPVGVDYDTNVTVNVQQSGSVTLSGFPVSAANPVSIFPITPSLALAEFATTAGLGVSVNAVTPALSLSPRQSSVTATNADFGAIQATRPRLELSAQDADVSARPRLQLVPPSTFVVDQITNDDAITDAPNNYLICDRTGFRIRVSEGLREEWDGTMVRARSFEARHPQDFVRSRPERLDGSKRPEQDDEFISDLYPNGLSAADL